MNDQDDRNKAIERLNDNGQEQPGTHADVLKKIVKKSLIVAKDGFVKEIGAGIWRKYDSLDDQ